MNLEEFANSFSKPSEKLSEVLKEWLIRRNYWEKEYDTLLHFRIKIDDVKIEVDNLLGTSSCGIRIMADEKGFYVNGNKIIGWSDNHIEKDGSFFYESGSNKYVFGADEIVCVIADSMVGVICSAIPEQLATNLDKIAEIGAGGLYMCLKEAWGANYVDKWQECKEDREIDNAQTVTKNQILVTKESVYVGENKEEILKWRDYILYNYKDGRLMFVKRRNLLNAIETSNPDVIKKDTLKVGIRFFKSVKTNNRSFKMDSFGGIFSRDKLEISDYAVKIKPSYNYLNKEKENISSEEFKYKINGDFEHAVVYLDYGKTKGGFYKFTIRIFVYVAELDDGNVIPLPIPGFEKHPLQIELSEGKKLSLAVDQFIDNEDNPGFNGCTILYAITRKQLRRIINSKKLKMILTGDNTTWTLKANDQIESFKCFENELFNSPQYVLDYLDAENAYDDGNYKLAAQKIKSPVNAKPENVYFKKLNQDIIAAREIIFAKDFANAKELHAQKKYGQALNAMNELVCESDKPEYKEFIDIVKNEWANISFREAQKEFTNSAYETAYEKIEHALSLRTDNEYESLKNKILEALEPYLKKKYTRLIQDDKVSKAVACAEKAHNIFPNSSWASNALDEAKKKRLKKRLTLAGIVGVCLLVALMVYSIFNTSNNEKTTSYNTNTSNSQSTNAEIITETAQQSNYSSNLEVVNTANDAYTNKSSSKYSGSHDFKGLIDGKYAITVHIDFAVDDGYSNIRGYYYYDKNGPDATLRLEGWTDGEFEMEIMEYNKKNVQTGIFLVTETSDDLSKIEGYFRTNGNAMSFVWTKN